MRFVRDTFTTFVAQIAAVLLALSASIVVARVLGPSGKGAYSLVILVPTMLVLVSNLGIGSANLYFGGRRKYSLSQLVSNSLVSAVMLGVLSSAFFLAYFFVFRPSFLGGVESGLIVLAAVTVPFSLLTGYFTHILLGQGRIRQYNLLQVTPGLVSMILILVLLLVVHLGVLGTVVAWVSGVLISSIVSIPLVLGLTKVQWSFEPRVLRDSIGFGVQTYLSNTMQFLNYRVDMLMVAYYLTVSDVGSYSIAVAVAEALWYFPGAVGTIVFARTPGLSSEEANRTTPRICRITVFITTIAALALLVLGRCLILLVFGAEFLPALEPLWYLLPGAAALSIWKVLSNELAGRGKPMVNAVVAGVSLALNVPLNLLLIPRMGISGAALASTISYSASAVMMLAVFTRVSCVGWFDTVVLKLEDLRLFATLLGTLRSRIRAAGASCRE